MEQNADYTERESSCHRVTMYKEQQVESKVAGTKLKLNLKFRAAIQSNLRKVLCE